jgi:hypothetical protein
MAMKRKKARDDDQEQRPTRSRGHHEEDEDADEELDLAAKPKPENMDAEHEQEEEEFGDDPVFELRSPSEDVDVDQRQVENVTERIFGAVLSRYGWRIDEKGHLEHLGGEEEQRPRRHR